MFRNTQFYQFVKSRPFFLFLFPVFFVLHGFTINYDSIPVKDALLLIIEYLGAATVLTVIFWFAFRNVVKAAMMTVSTMAVHFFFGNILDTLNNSFPESFAVRYRFQLPFLFFVLLAIFVGLKRIKRALFGSTFFLNTLFFVFIVADAGWLLYKVPSVTKSKIFNAATEGFTILDSVSRPDIYFIIPDQYTGHSALKEVFHFDNTAFENELRSRGFYIATKSSSNYNFTPFSVASTLNMDYLSLNKGPQNYETVNYSYRIIRNSRVLKFLAASGYQFYNCSIFDFDEHPAHKYSAFLPYGEKLITDRTFTSRIWHDFQNDIIEGKYGLEKLRRRLVYENLEFNDRIFDLTARISAQKTQSPKFVYTHLMIPHYPYYFNSAGHPVPIEKLTNLNKSNSEDYIEYLQYGNKKLLKLVDNILSKSSPPIIVILSDHGFRHPQKSVDPAYDFINLNAVYFPDKNYGRFYDGITNVNQFRVIFNSCFNQHLSLLKDSSTNLRD